MPHSPTRSSALPRTTAEDAARPLAAPLVPVVALPPATPVHPSAPLTRRESLRLEAAAAGRLAAAAAAPSVSAGDAVSISDTVSAGAGASAFASRRDRRAAERHHRRSRPAAAAPARARVARKHLVLAMSGGLVVAAIATGVGVLGAAPTVTATASAEAEPEVAPVTATALPVADSGRVVLSAVSGTSGTVAGGTSVTLSGSNLDAIAAVRFGDLDGAVSVVNAGQVTVTAPPAPGDAQGTVAVAFYDTAGQQITFDAVSDTAASATADGATEAADGTAALASDPAPTATATPSSSATASASVGLSVETGAALTGVLATTKVVASTLAFDYTPDPAIEAAKAAAALAATRLASQLTYVETYWDSYNSAQYGVISGSDCVNFTSQSLVARGWTMDDAWSYSGAGGYSTAWASSTAFNDYLAAHPERATALGNDQRDQVKPGDVVQFDWDGSGDWDHTGIVTSVDGDTILYASHTVDNFDQDIDSASAGRIMFWSV